MEDQHMPQNFLEIFLENRKKNAVTPVTKVTNDVTNYNNTLNCVTILDEKVVTDRLHSLISPEYIDQTEGGCLGFSCHKVFFDNGLKCRSEHDKNGNLFLGKGCPEGKWKTHGISLNEQNGAITCPVCGASDWWQLAEGSKKICMVCHPKRPDGAETRT